MADTPPPPSPDRVHPPTEPLPDPAMSEDPRDRRLARLERLIKLQMLGMIILLIAVGGLVGVQVWMGVERGVQAKAQLQLLADLQSDFGQLENNNQDLYQMLRRSANDVRRIYQPMQDQSDLEGLLDNLLGQNYSRQGQDADPRQQQR